MITTRDYAFFMQDGHELLSSLIDWREMSQAELAEVARRYGRDLEFFVEPDKRGVEPVTAPTVKQRVEQHLDQSFAPSPRQEDQDQWAEEKNREQTELAAKIFGM